MIIVTVCSSKNKMQIEQKSKIKTNENRTGKLTRLFELIQWTQCIHKFNADYNSVHLYIESILTLYNNNNCNLLITFAILDATAL